MSTQKKKGLLKLQSGDRQEKGTKPERHRARDTDPANTNLNVIHPHARLKHRTNRNRGGSADKEGKEDGRSPNHGGQLDLEDDECGGSERKKRRIDLGWLETHFPSFWTFHGSLPPGFRPVNPTIRFSPPKTRLGPSRALDESEDREAYRGTEAEIFTVASPTPVPSADGNTLAQTSDPTRSCQRPVVDCGPHFSACFYEPPVKAWKECFPSLYHANPFELPDPLKETIRIVNGTPSPCREERSLDSLSVASGTSDSTQARNVGNRTNGRSTPLDGDSSVPDGLMQRFADLWSRSTFVEQLILHFPNDRHIQLGLATLKLVDPAEGDEKGTVSGRAASLTPSASHCKGVGGGRAKLEQRGWRATQWLLRNALDYGSVWTSMSHYVDVDMILNHWLIAERMRRLCVAHSVRHLMACNRQIDLLKSLYPDVQDFRIEGWHSPKILVLCPTRFVALQWIENLAFLFDIKHAHGIERLLREFGDDDSDDLEPDVSCAVYNRGPDSGRDDENETDDALSAPADPSMGEGEKAVVDWRELLKRAANPVYEPADTRKGLDYLEEWRGNCNDKFLVGVQVLKNEKKIQVFSNFQKSDIILASPLGIVDFMSSPDESGVNQSEGVDFLSSIQILFIDKMETLIEQNFDHLQTVLSIINLTPKLTPSKSQPARHGAKSAAGGPTSGSPTGVHIMRLYGYHIFESGSKYDLGILYRQTVSLRAFKDFLGSQLLQSRALNFRGRIKFVKKLEKLNHRANLLLFNSSPSSDAPTLIQRSDSVLQVFKAHFINNYFAKLQTQKILVIVPTYLEYLEVKKSLREGLTASQFAVIHENSSLSSSTRARHFFKDGRKKILVATERFLIFRRVRIASPDFIVFVGAPKNPNVLVDILSANAESPTCLIYWDEVLHMDNLERIVGTDRMFALLEKKQKHLISIS